MFEIWKLDELWQMGNPKKLCSRKPCKTKDYSTYLEMYTLKLPDGLGLAVEHLLQAFLQFLDIHEA